MLPTTSGRRMLSDHPRPSCSLTPRSGQRGCAFYPTALESCIIRAFVLVSRSARVFAFDTIVWKNKGGGDEKDHGNYRESAQGG